MQRYGVVLMGWLGAVMLLGGTVYAAEVSPRQEVQDNFKQLMETNSCPGCDLSGAVLNRFNFSGADLAGANLAGAKLYLADLSGANLTGANLQGTALGGTDLAGADLTGANLTGAILEGAYLVGAKMDGQIVTQRPYVKDGGPPSGEMIFVDDEGSSKNLPYANQVVVSPVEDKEQEDKDIQVVEEETVPDTVPGGAVLEAIASPESSQADSVTPETAVVSLPPSPSKPSKKLVMIGEPVLPTPEPIVETIPDPAVKLMAEARVDKTVDPADSVGKKQQDVSVETIEEEIPGATVSQPEEMVSSESAPVGMEKRERPTGPEPQENEVIAVIPMAMEKAEPEAKPEPVAEMEVANEFPVEDKSPQVDPVEMVVEEVVIEQVPDATLEKQMLVEKLLDENRCVGCDLSGVDLSGRHLDEADLERANLQEANLSDTDLSEANLKGADMRGADLRDADLREADLYRANLNGADLTGARFEDALVDSIYAADAIGADFKGAVGNELSSPFLGK